MSSDDEGQDLVAEAIDFREPEAPVAIAKKTNFLPWHRPRKQHVRVNQWCAQTRALVVRRKSEFSNRPLSYLGLPGEDLLDIRVLHDAVAPEGVKLRYLGFNSGKNVESSISEVEVNALPAIDGAKSRILGDTFEAIAISATIAAKTAREFAPFDVVNLDLCRSVAKAAPGSEHSVFEALKCVLELQDKTQAGEWMLFLTTHANPESVDERALSILLQCIKDNATKHAAFGPHLDRSLGVTATGLEQPAGLGSTEFALAFALGVGKWLLNTVAGQVRAWEVELTEENFWYGIAGDSPDMLSLSFRFSRRPSVQDGTGLTKPSATTSIKDELTLATGMIDGLVKITDPEALFRLDSTKRDKATRQSRELLVNARYDGDAYMEWVQKPERAGGPAAR